MIAEVEKTHGDRFGHFARLLERDEPVSYTHLDVYKRQLINHEFTFSTRGVPLSGKLYTFRANPKKVEILTQMGVDLVGLANNHIYDYGQDAFFDTLDTIDGAGIDRIGAGRNLQEACTPQYYIVNCLLYTS